MAEHGAAPATAAELAKDILTWDYDTDQLAKIIESYAAARVAEATRTTQDVHPDAGVSFWYEVRPDDHGSDWQALCRVMQGLANESFGDWDRPAWEEFARYVSETALDQEVYGEALLADPAPLELMWAAFRAGWEARR